jgi:glycosyltransferase involved in cell wall biosynthesis
LRFASQILTISQFTKNEIIKFLGIPAKKVKVIYLGVGREFRRVTDRRRLTKVMKKFRLQTPFLFYAGSLSPRKNILRLVMAFHALVERIPHHLYLVSGRRWNAPNIEHYIKQNDLEHRIHLLPHLEDYDLISFYSLASAFIYPTLYEGFGLPVIEALACGCIPVVSRSIPAREIVKKNVIYVDPTRVNSISAGLANGVQKKAFKSPLVKRWEKVAEEYLLAFAS